MSSHCQSLPLASGLDALSDTFSSDMEFCEGLAKAQPNNTARILVLHRWALRYLPAIQNGFIEMVENHFSSAHSKNAGIWTASLTGGLTRDVGLVPYFALRGLVWEAGTAARRGLENVALLAHLWADPAKAIHLDDPDGRDFRNAFINEADKQVARELGALAIQKRFAASTLGPQLSQLYRLLSKFSVHGASPDQLVSTQKTPTRLSCMFVHRPDPTLVTLGSELKLFGNALEMLCLEVATIFGRAARKHQLVWSEAHEGGNTLSQLLNQEDPLLQALIEESLKDLGWVSTRYS